MPKKPVSRAKAKEIMRHGEVRGHTLTKKQRGLFGAIAGGASMRKYHKSPDSYGDTALGETPPRTEYHAAQEVGSDAHPRAVGSPAGVARSDGVENLRADYATHEAGISKAAPKGAPNRTPSGVRSYKDGVV